MIRSGATALSALTHSGRVRCLAQHPRPRRRKLRAKTTAEMATHDEPAMFKARVNLVMVPVVVRDRKGNAVGNLKQEDFQLFDKGKPQYIARFSMERAAGRLIKAGGAAATAARTSRPRRSPRPTCRIASSPTCSTTCT